MKGLLRGLIGSVLILGSIDRDFTPLLIMSLLLGTIFLISAISDRKGL